ncbi:MAG: trypsin-like peptidase domain-containing protein [Pseudomonadota bacterium]
MRVPESQAEIAMGFVPVVQHSAPAVVNIYARHVVSGQASPFRGDPFFDNLFRNLRSSRPRIQNSLGSGVILSGDGLVVSNYHVVGESKDIRVVLNDRREFSARVLLSDEESDLAVLQLDGAEALPALSLRDSDTVQVGELVLAIGNPFGVGQTVSSGIVSGLARSGTATGSARGYFLQTDAPINPGNSGGALVDVQGRLIGINTRILSRSGGSNGIGFAIPSALVAQVLEQARAGHDVFRRPWAGITGQPVTADMAEGLGLARPGGVIIAALHPASALAQAGFQPGDVITSLDDHAVHSPAEMIYRMSVAGLGRTLKITRFQDGKEDVVDLRLTRAPEVPPRGTRITGARTALPDMTVSLINPAVIAEYGLPLSAEGVVVDNPGPAGSSVGLRRGDILLELNGVPVENPAQAEVLLREGGRWLSLEVQRGERRSSLRLRL